MRPPERPSFACRVRARAVCVAAPSILLRIFKLSTRRRYCTDFMTVCGSRPPVVRLVVYIRLGCSTALAFTILAPGLRKSDHATTWASCAKNFGVVVSGIVLHARVSLGVEEKTFEKLGSIRPNAGVPAVSRVRAPQDHGQPPSRSSDVAI